MAKVLGEPTDGMTVLFFAGVLTGVVTALLLAPRPGQELAGEAARATGALKDQMEKMVAQGRSLLDRLEGGLEGLFDGGRKGLEAFGKAA